MDTDVHVFSSESSGVKLLQEVWHACDRAEVKSEWTGVKKQQLQKGQISRTTCTMAANSSVKFPTVIVTWVQLHSTIMTVQLETHILRDPNYVNIVSKEPVKLSTKNEILQFKIPFLLLFVIYYVHFQHHYSSLSVTRSIRNHSNMLICCSRNILFYYVENSCAFSYFCENHDTFFMTLW